MKISKNDGSNTYLFLPAADFVSGTSFTYVGSYGRYWSGTAAPLGFACNLGFSSDDNYIYANDESSRFAGFSVRPVRLVAE